MKKQTFTFTFTATITRKSAEKLLDIIIVIFQLAGLELGVDFVGGFHKDVPNGKS